MAEKCVKDGCSNTDVPTSAEGDGRCNTHYQEYLAGKAKRDERAGKVGGWKDEPDRKKRASRKKKVEEPAPADEAPKEE